MRKLQSNIGIFGNMIVRQGIQLIVCGEGLRSLGASSLWALRTSASRQSADFGDALGLWLRSRLAWMTPRIGPAGCFVTVKQPARRHEMCHRPVA